MPGIIGVFGIISDLSELCFCGPCGPCLMYDLSYLSKKIENFMNLF